MEKKLNSGLIGIFYCKTNDKASAFYSVSVRRLDKPEALKKALIKEHNGLELELLKCYCVKTDKEISEIEKIIRKVLKVTFGDYQSYEKWEHYFVNKNYSERQDFVEFVCQLVDLLKTVKYIEEL